MPWAFAATIRTNFGYFAAVRRVSFIGTSNAHNKGQQLQIHTSWFESIAGAVELSFVDTL